ncbi:MAG: endonuclease/exonuclease/phosphatase family protein [Magnetospirillum sp. WYHS-4]
MDSVAFRIATFNVENLGEPSSGVPPLKDRIAVLRPQLIRLRADVLCLQEVDGQSLGRGKRRDLKALDALLEGTPYAAFHRAHTVSGSRGGGVRDKHNLVILSRFPILEHGQVRHDLVPPPLYRRVTAHPPSREPEIVDWDRAFVFARLGLGDGRSLTVVNLHLRAPRAAWVAGQKADSRLWRSVPGWAEGYFLAAIKQAGQALEARLFIDGLMDRDLNALIAVLGDFNAGLHETPVRTIRGDEEDTGNGHLAPRMLVPLERSLPESQRFSVIHGGRPQMLDHILVSQSLLAWFRGGEIHNEALGDELSTAAVVQGIPASLHAPVVASFEIP